MLLDVIFGMLYLLGFVVYIYVAVTFSKFLNQKIVSGKVHPKYKKLSEVYDREITPVLGGDYTTISKKMNFSFLMLLSAYTAAISIIHWSFL